MSDRSADTLRRSAGGIIVRNRRRRRMHANSGSRFSSFVIFNFNFFVSLDSIPLDWGMQE